MGPDGESAPETPGESRARRLAALDPQVHVALVEWFGEYLGDLYDRYLPDEEGELASYIP